MTGMILLVFGFVCSIFLFNFLNLLLLPPLLLGSHSLPHPVLPSASCIHFGAQL